jgi:hypothetical protein
MIEVIITDATGKGYKGVFPDDAYLEDIMEGLYNSLKLFGLKTKESVGVEVIKPDEKDLKVMVK